MVSKYLSFFKRRILKNNPFFHRRLRVLQHQQEYSREQLLDQQNAQLIRLIHHAYKNSGFYRNLYDEHGVNMAQIKDRGDLAKLPVVEKDMVKQHTERLLTTSPIFCTKAFTSGTSGSPLMVYRDYRSTIEEEAYLWRQRIEFGHSIGSKSVSMRGDLKADTFKVYDPFSRTLHLSSFMLSGQTVEQYYREILNFAPKAIYAYPSSVEILAGFLLEKGLKLSIPYVFTSSETLYEFQRQKIEEAFTTRIVDWYGNAERTIALEEGKGGSYDELPLYSVNEYQDDRTITTGLINFSFPLIRYEVHDIIIPSDHSGKISQIIGRADDSVVLPDGKKVGRLDVSLKGLEGIKYTQIIQLSSDKLNINVVPDKSFNEGLREKLRNNLIERLGSSIELNFMIIDESQIIRSSRGKYKLVINQCNLHSNNINKVS